MKALTGTGRLLRLAARRDRVMILATVVVVWVMTYTSAVATQDLYAAGVDRVMANEAANSSTAAVAMYGHIHDTSSVGGIGSNKAGMLNYVILAFLAIAIVRRHTRAEEESGRFELLGAAPVGRLAPLAAALGLAAATSLVAGLGSIGSAIAGGWPTTGSVAFGLAQAGVGLAFCAVAAICMQLSASTRTGSSWAYGALGLAFVLRMLGDVYWDQPAAFLSWLSPLGWAQQMRPYDGDRFWPLLVPLLFTAAAVAVAVVLESRRDLGAGLIPDRPGPAHGTTGSPLALAWRLERGLVIGWLIAYLIMGVLFGTIVSTLGGLLSGPAEEMLRRMGGVGTFNDLYITMIGLMSAFGVAAFGVAVVMRLRTEESAGRVEEVLATPVRRLTYVGSFLSIALLGGVALVVTMGAAMAGTHALAGESSGFWREFSPNLAQLPAIWVMVALTIVAIGWLPRFDWLGWGLLSAVILIGELGGLMGLPDWVMKLSPFAHVPKLPVEAMNWTPVLTLAALAVALMAVGLLGYRRRDIPVA